MTSLHGSAAPAPSPSSSSSKRVNQVKTNSKLNLISPRSFKFPGEKLLKKIGSSKEKETTLTLSTSVSTRHGRSKRHHSLDDLEDSLRRNVSFGRKGAKKDRDAIGADGGDSDNDDDDDDDKGSLWGDTYGDSTTTSSGSDSDADWRDPTWVLDEWEEEERRLWREKKQREKEELERRQREAAGLPPLPPLSTSTSTSTTTTTTTTPTQQQQLGSVSAEAMATPVVVDSLASSKVTTRASSRSTPTSPTAASKAAHQRRNSRVEIVAVEPLREAAADASGDGSTSPGGGDGGVRSSSREWPLRRARSFSETGEARVVKSKQLDPGMKKRSLSSHSLSSSSSVGGTSTGSGSSSSGKQKLKRRESREDSGGGRRAYTDEDDDTLDEQLGSGSGSGSSSGKREKKRKNSIKRKSGSGILSTFAGISKLSAQSESGGGESSSSGGGGFLQSVKRRGRSLSGRGKDKGALVERDKDHQHHQSQQQHQQLEQQQQVHEGHDGRSPTQQKLSRSDEKVPATPFDLEDLRSPRHSVCVTRLPGHSPASSRAPPLLAPSPSSSLSTTTAASPVSMIKGGSTVIYPKRERASSTPFVPRLKLPSHSPATPKSYFSPASAASSSSSAIISPGQSPLSSPLGPTTSSSSASFSPVSRSTTSIPLLMGEQATLGLSPRGYASLSGLTPATSPNPVGSSFLHNMPHHHRTPPLSPKGAKATSRHQHQQQQQQSITKSRSSSLSGPSGSEGEERLTWSNVWHSTTIEREMEIEAEVEMEMEIEERARSDELELSALHLPRLGSASGGRTESRERVARAAPAGMTTTTTTASTMAASEVPKKRTERHSGGAVAVSAAGPAGIEMRSPEVLRWSGEQLSRRSFRRSSLTGSQPGAALAALKSVDSREEALLAREEALRESEDKVRQERDEFERERAQWEREREKLLLELRRLRILQEGVAPGGATTTTTGPEPIAALQTPAGLWSPQQRELRSAAGARSPLPPLMEELPGQLPFKEGAAEQENNNHEGEDDEPVTEAACAHCREKDETLRKLERELKRLKYLYYEANGKLMEGTMRDKNREKHHSGGSLHRSDSAESASTMTATTPRSRLKETASLVFHEPASKTNKQPSSRRSDRGSPHSPRAAPKT